MTLRQRLNDIALRNISRLHHGVVRASAGRVGWSALGMQVVQLHTTGRKSGLPHSVMLTAPVVDGERIVLVASKNGDDRDPDWYRNLQARPEAGLTIGGRRRLVQARTASPDEKADLWPRVVTAYYGYENYQRRTRRDIPLVICDPR
jgi:deazaflavin-dependent oxidoreductase (nitroreductase family)